MQAESISVIMIFKRFGSGHGLIGALFRNFYVGIEEVTEAIIPDCRSPCRDFNLESPDYKTEALTTLFNPLKTEFHLNNI
jgi:hypothetical protein